MMLEQFFEIASLVVMGLILHAAFSVHEKQWAKLWKNRRLPQPPSGTYDDRGMFADGLRPEVVLDIPEAGHSCLLLAVIKRGKEQIPEAFSFVVAKNANTGVWHGKLVCRNDRNLDCGDLTITATLNNRLFVSGLIHNRPFEREVVKR